jgi:ATP dependent DNA ligase-like protein
LPLVPSRQASFDKLRHRSHDPEVFLVAFDLLELDGNDLRREPLEVRKQTLASLLRGSLPGVQFNAHLTHPGDIVFENACKMGLEGIVSKRLGSRYRSGRTSDSSSRIPAHAARCVGADLFAVTGVLFLGLLSARRLAARCRHLAVLK